MKTTLLLFITLFFAILTGSCQLPRATTPSELTPDAIYTIAAETVVAHYTQEAADHISEVDTLETTQTTTPTESTQTIEPSITGEPTSTSTLTETPTQTKIPNAILEDNFVNTSLWYVAVEDEFGFEYQDGSYRIFNDILNGAIWSIKYQEFQDIRVEVDATRNAGPEDGYYGVICRFANEGSDYYGLVMNDGGFYGILKMEEGELEFLKTGLDENDIIKGDGDTNRIQGVCMDDRLILYINDMLMLEIVDDDLTEGIVGLVAGNRLSGVGIDVSFDNFALLWP